MKKHVTLVAAIQIGFSILGLIGAMILFFALGFARSQVTEDETARKVLGILIGTLPVVIGVMSAAGLTGGIGLFSYKPWARHLVIVVAALGCLNIPFGTAKGIYALWVLLQNDAIKLFSGEKANSNVREEITV